ncbi:MAG: aldehyde dehydrogenase family protein [Xanthomonadales bacterium]|jgi:aldehyde dehydrogenase (NAD+)|nr:aldehyde dehydrogenase family protein [Xanthomonadales bacterium]
MNQPATHSEPAKNTRIERENAGAGDSRTEVSPDYHPLVERLRAAFRSDRTRSVEWRDQQLAALKRMLLDHETDFLDALGEDLGKPHLEGWMTELSYVTGEIDHCRKHLRRWMKPRRVSTPVFALPGKSWVQAEPLGVMLVMSAWNYPLQIALAPLAAAIAAGNCAVVKPSELAPATSALLARHLTDYLDPECFAVVEGAVEESTALLRERFDHIIYTGGGTVGRIVMAAAAKHLTPVTLELGGKSPCIVLPDTDLEIAARRIAWGRFMNAGQTCVAPDYVLTDEATERRLVPLVAEALEGMFGQDPQASDSYGRIVNRRHFDRLTGLLEGATVAIGGRTDRDDRYIEPTVLTGVSAGQPVMREEIFGPILPILRIDSLEDAIDHIRDGDKPLAAYLFTKDEAAQQRFLQTVSAGSVCLNDVIMFSAVPELPFGGVGESGMGAYNGERGFLNFSHGKAVMKRSLWPDIALRYAPYTRTKFSLLRKLR